MSHSKTPASARKLGLAELVLAYELRQEYGMSWKLIARELQADAVALCSAVHKAIDRGLHGRE